MYNLTELYLSTSASEKCLYDEDYQLQHDNFCVEPVSQQCCLQELDFKYSYSC